MFCLSNVELSLSPSLPNTQGFPLVKNLTVAILQLSESGELTYLREKWWPSSCIGAEGAQDSEPLQPHSLRGLFLLLGLGLGLGLLMALLELASKARSQAKDNKVRQAGRRMAALVAYREDAWQQNWQ